jgi:serine/threonine protein kinase
MPNIYRTGQRIDHYQIIRPLGPGAASQVYLAQDWRAQREVVLKFPDDELIGGAAVFERYQREAEIGKRLDHPRLVRHLNQGEQRSKEYLVMEYLHGRTLRAVMQERAPALLPPAEVRCILLQVCEALHYAHKNGVIHRDIKPENILLLPSDDVKLLDFGIALIQEERRVRAWGLSSPIGTPDYMAPERLRGRDGDTRADIYAVGVVLYELLCGRTPFEEHDGFPLVTRHTSHDPPDILGRNPSVSLTLATVVMRAIRRDPGKRYACMQDLLNDLQCLDTVTPVDYVPDRPKLGGRYRQAIRIALIVLAVCLLVIAFGFFAQGMHPFVR